MAQATSDQGLRHPHGPNLLQAAHFFIDLRNTGAVLIGANALRQPSCPLTDQQCVRPQGQSAIFKGGG